MPHTTHGQLPIMAPLRLTWMKPGILATERRISKQIATFDSRGEVLTSFSCLQSDRRKNSMIRGDAHRQSLRYRGRDLMLSIVLLIVINIKSQALAKT